MHYTPYFLIHITLVYYIIVTNFGIYTKKIKKSLDKKLKMIYNMCTSSILNKIIIFYPPNWNLKGKYNLKSKYEERYDMYAFTELTALLEFVEKHRADLVFR